MDEYFERDENGDIVLVSNNIRYKITFAIIDDVDHFYQYPTKDDFNRGQTKPKIRKVSEVSDFLPE